ncbi:hypothetical protein SE92_03720 [Bradyrhizobium sp. AT1]|nr:hypothetical protein SE92_03720 [Bradyrhizobium sp. AT1]
MATIDLTEEDIRVLQHIAERGEAGITTDRAVPRYRVLAKAGLLEHQAVSLDAEWFGLSDRGRGALGDVA